jgi:hypothetical protein
MVLFSAHFAGAQTLGDVITENGWDPIIGTWVDEKSGGESIKMTYRWKFEGTVIETTYSGNGSESVGLIGRNPKNGEIFNISANSKGGGSIGKWTFSGLDATLEASFVTHAGNEGSVKIQMHLESKDALVLTIEAKEPKVIRLMRYKERDPFAP